MPPERNSLVQSFRLTGDGFSIRLRIDRRRPQDLEEFLRENDLTARIDFDDETPARPTLEDPDTTQVSTAA